MPLEQLSNNLDFFSFFVASKQAVTGLTVTVDVWKHLTSTNTSSQIVTAGSASEVGGGLYRYQLSSASVTEEGEYICIFKTTSTTPDQQHIPSIWCVQKAGSEYQDAATSTRLAPAGLNSLQADVAAIKAPVVAYIDAGISSRLPANVSPSNSYISGQIADVKVIAQEAQDKGWLNYTMLFGTYTPAGSMSEKLNAVKATVDTNLNATVSSRLAASAYATSLGAGAIAYTVTLLQPGTITPIAGAEVWVTSNSAGTTVVAGVLLTNSSGQSTFMVDAGSYYLWVQAPGWNFTNPQTFVVS